LFYIGWQEEREREKKGGLMSNEPAIFRIPLSVLEIAEHAINANNPADHSLYGEIVSIGPLASPFRDGESNRSKHIDGSLV